MKTKPLICVLIAFFALMGIWFGRAAWRAHNRLVTLTVREMPIAEVLRKIERQSWIDIPMDETLDARITLSVKNKPLSQVLDLIAEQAGARWSTLYAVHDSSGALRALDSTLRTRANLESNGWTHVAPVMTAPPPKAGASGPKQLPPPGAGPMLVMRKGNTVMHGGPGGEFEVWSPEELVVESRFLSKLSIGDDLLPTAETAAHLAKQINGQWTSIIAFRKSSMGVGFRRPPSQPRLEGAGPNPNDHFARLTPAQRIERARSRPVPPPGLHHPVLPQP